MGQNEVDKKGHTSLSGLLAVNNNFRAMMSWRMIVW